MPDSHARRKLEHLRICIEDDVSARTLGSGLQSYQLHHCALPELDLAEVDLTTRFLGHDLRAPLMVSAMTGGTSEARKINHNLAAAAQALGLAMCVGSQRAAIEDPRLAHTYQVRDAAPGIMLCANLGAVQLNYGYGPTECQQAVDMIDADALVLHLNPLQEALQPGGNANFSGLIEKIAAVCSSLAVPVVVKEVGWGLSEHVVCKLCEAGVSAVDVAGAGGTSWSEVEKRRAQTTLGERVATAFREWGIPTAQAILEARRAAPELPIIASGGVQTGPDAAVALALGADLVGLARPLLRPATTSAQSVQDELTVLTEGLRVAMFCAGTRDVPALKRATVTCR